MDHADNAAGNAVRGETVRVRVDRHAPWGVLVTILDLPDIGASVDAVNIDSPSNSPRALEEEFPPVGAEMDAVITRVNRRGTPPFVYLSVRAADLDVFRDLCDFCGKPAVLSAGGDGLTMEATNADRSVVIPLAAHRGCLPQDTGHAALLDRLTGTPAERSSTR